MSDLISRSELTAAIKHQYCTDCNNYNGVRCRACHADDMLSLVDDAADAGPHLISVKERLPEELTDVLTKCRNGAAWFYGIGHVFQGKWKVDGIGGTVDVVTYWMPLPEPPKEE